MGRGSAGGGRERGSRLPRCPLHRGRTNAVPGEGNPLSDVLLVGEGPGAREDATGRPFVGPAGQLLNELLRSLGWAREDVFIANVVKCRPPGNRDPEPDEIAACSSYLDRQEAALEPAVIVTLGRHSLARYLPGARISARCTASCAVRAAASFSRCTILLRRCTRPRCARRCSRTSVGCRRRCSPRGRRWRRSGWHRFQRAEPGPEPVLVAAADDEEQLTLFQESR